MIRRAWMASASVVLVCILVLAIEYAAEVRRTPHDEVRIAALQEEVRSDASVAARLEAEQKGISDARRGRRARAKVLSWVLITAGAAFITFGKLTPPPARKKTDRAGSAPRVGKIEGT